MEDTKWATPLRDRPPGDETARRNPMLPQPLCTVALVRLAAVRLSSWLTRSERASQNSFVTWSRGDCLSKRTPKRCVVRTVSRGQCAEHYRHRSTALHLIKPDLALFAKLSG